METFVLCIIAPSGSSNYEVEWVELITPTGNLTIQKGHAPFVTLLKSNEALTYKEADGKEKYIEVFGGIARVNREGVTILIEK